MADLLSTIRAEIDARLRELAPAIAEYERLTSAADALTVEGRVAEGRGGKGRTAGRPAESTGAESSAPGPAPARAKARPGSARRARVGGARGGRGRTVESPASQAILAALEHGSHTIAELVLVSALPAADIREALRHLRKRKTIVKTERDGRSAYALPAPAA